MWMHGSPQYMLAICFVLDICQLPSLVWGEGIQIPCFKTFIGDFALGVEATSAQATVHSGELAFGPLEPDSLTLAWFSLVLRGDCYLRGVGGARICWSRVRKTPESRYIDKLYFYYL